MNNLVDETSSTLLSQLNILYVDHVAVTTYNLEKTLSDYLSLPGSRLWRGPANNMSQKVRYAFVQITQGLTIEILSPLTDDSPIHTHLKKNSGPYHICYAVENIYAAVNLAKRLGAIPIVEPIADPAFDERKIAFILHPDHGLIELVEAYPDFKNQHNSSNQLAINTHNPHNNLGCSANKISAIFHNLMPSLSPLPLNDLAMDNFSEWDSLMHIRLLMALEAKLHCHIPSVMFNKLTSYKTILKWAESLTTDNNAHYSEMTVNKATSNNKEKIKAKSDARILRHLMQSELDNYNGKPALIHTDIIQTAPFIADSIVSPLEAHHQFLDSCAIDWLVPAFNYQFPKTHNLDLRTAQIEVGTLNQYLLDQKWADYRTFDPMFSILGKGENPLKINTTLDAFGEDSIFSHLVKKNGIVVMYGAKINSLTLLHYAESQYGGVPYRYNKLFSGVLIDDVGHPRSITWNCHVRPWQHNLDYDWDKIEDMLINDGVIRPLVKSSPTMGFYMDAKRCIHTLITALKHDPLILLDATSREWVDTKLNTLGRPFLLSDFESEQ